MSVVGIIEITQGLQAGLDQRLIRVDKSLKLRNPAKKISRLKSLNSIDENIVDTYRSARVPAPGTGAVKT